MAKAFIPFSISLIALFFIHSRVYNQTAIINYNSNVTYFAAQEEPPSDWFMPEFDDSSWTVDTNMIGYGESMQQTTVSKETKSLYLRYKINFTNPQDIEKLSFIADYDDGYIAYLNGKEILRVNVSNTVKYPAFDDITTRSHETQYYQQYPVYGYYLDTLVLDTCLVEGENIFAVHVLNDSLNGSDLHFYLRLYDLTNMYYNLYHISNRYKRQYFIDSVDFPLVIIETDEFGIPYKNRRVDAFMGIIDNGPGAYNKPTDSCNVFYGKVSIEVRGESSSEFPKRSYRFEFKDSLDRDSNAAILGMPANDDWILFGPFQDKSQFRNPMVFDLARRFGRYQPRTRFCEVIFNGESVGLYTMIETIKRGENRIDIARLRPDETDGLDVTGGYIMKYDKPNGYFEVIYPKDDEIAPEQLDYITGFKDEYESVLFSNNFMDPYTGFRKYINDTSLADYIIMIEFPKNCDGYYFSTYLYKDRADRDNRFVYGPVWDNDLSFGNTIFQDGAFTDGWHFEYRFNHTNIYIKRMLQDREFVNLLQNRWNMARNSFLNTDSVMAYIDSSVAYLANPVARNYYVWPLIDVDIWHSNYVAISYEDEINIVKNWITDRLDWIDDNIGDIYYDVVIYTGTSPELTQSYFGFEVFPNPFNDELNITFSASSASNIRIDIFDISGQLRYSENRLLSEGLSQIQVENTYLQNLLPGIYFLIVSNGNGIVSSRKLVKQ
jgi:hypothetical protein